MCKRRSERNMASRKPMGSRPRMPNMEEMLQMIESATDLRPEEKLKLREEVIRSMTEPIPMEEDPDITDSKAWEILIVAFLLFLISSSIGTVALRLVQRERNRLARKKEAKGQPSRKKP